MISGVLFIAVSMILYLAEIEIFHAPRDTIFYFFQDLAFVPIQVLLVTLIIHRLLNEREKRSRREKLNMVVGVFFSEAGRELLACFSGSDPEIEKIRKDLVVTSNSSDKEFNKINRRIKNDDFGRHIGEIDLVSLRTFVIHKKDFLLRLLENPNLLEHESFTELLLAVFHLVEELSFREDIARIPEMDYAHIVGDIRKAYTLLAYEWLEYMKHLKEAYPYLFSLAIRMNPFDQAASPIIRK